VYLYDSILPLPWMFAVRACFVCTIKLRCSWCLPEFAVLLVCLANQLLLLVGQTLPFGWPAGIRFIWVKIATCRRTLLTKIWAHYQRGEFTKDRRFIHSKISPGHFRDRPNVVFTETVSKVICSLTAETESEWRYVWYHLITATNRLRDVDCWNDTVAAKSNLHFNSCSYITAMT